MRAQRLQLHSTPVTLKSVASKRSGHYPNFVFVLYTYITHCTQHTVQVFITECPQSVFSQSSCITTISLPHSSVFTSTNTSIQHTMATLFTSYIRRSVVLCFPFSLLLHSNMQCVCPVSHVRHYCYGAHNRCRSIAIARRNTNWQEQRQPITKRAKAGTVSTFNDVDKYIFGSVIKSCQSV
jgi:hypothetical protein